MTLAEKQCRLIEQINSVGDCFDQYSYLLVRAGQLAAMPDCRKTEDRLVAGCQSKVWLQLSVHQGRLSMEADSDTLILRGVLAVLIELLDGEKASEVAVLPITLLQETELAATFTSARTAGMTSILKRIQAVCEEADKT